MAGATLVADTCGGGTSGDPVRGSAQGSREGGVPAGGTGRARGAAWGARRRRALLAAPNPQAFPFPHPRAQIISILSSPTEAASAGTATCEASADDTPGCSLAFRLGLQPLKADRHYFLAGAHARAWQ